MSTNSSRHLLRWTAAILPALLWLSGCGAPASVGDLRTNPFKVISFEMPADCATVYLRIARRAQERYRYTKLATFQPGVSAKLAPDGQSAAITLFNAGGIGMHYLLTADLHARDDSRTAVDVYCASGSATKEAQVWRQWANTPLDAGPQQTPPPTE
jgi:hypothetical protein